ncbi:MAG: class I tRNA ligase family protein, partial [Rhodospirillales bacterium]|nr:class I tRNA ligase family protein [Rhodospirillales bacterium]
RRQVHKTIAAVTEDLDRFHFNKAVARIRELTNILGDLPAAEDGAGWVYREGMETVTLLIGPMMPHLAEEMWRLLGHDGMLAEARWPKAEADLLVDSTVNLAVQVNGKMRGTVVVPMNADQKTAETAALALDTVQAAISGKPVRKIILVPNRIVNVVV